MIRIGILLAVVLAILAWRWLKKNPSALAGKQLKQVAWIAGGLLAIALLATGKLNGLIALLGVTIAFLVRSIPFILSYAPQLHKIWLKFNDAKSRESGGSQRADGSSRMTHAQAFQILGLAPGASEQDIIQAHRKLISRVHPDRGGSDYLAAQINQAKKILLGR